MKILLTGSSGMVGRNILEHPHARKYEFLKPSSSELNLLDRRLIDRYLSKYQPDLIIHAAGKVGGIQANLSEPVKFIFENMEMGFNLISSAKESNIKSLINLASSCMYPRFGNNPLKEDMILKGELEPTNEGYAIAKIACTRLCEYINQENDELSYKTLIPCNLYGKYDNFDSEKSHMIPAVIKKIYDAKQLGKRQIDIWGDGKSRREFMYAGDFADFIFFAIENLNSMPQNINVGIGNDFSIKDYYKTIANVIGFDGEFKYDVSKPAGMRQKLIDNSLLEKFGWRPSTSLEEGIKETLNYYIEINR